MTRIKPANTSGPEVTSHGWLIITRDAKIKDHHREITAVLEHKARMGVLTSAEARSTWTQLEILMSRWREIERCVEESGPFLYIATRTRMKRLELQARA